ncbi:MAG: DUF4347 domain-containing protein [Okeania sp. SIO3I5]|uniref:DUF4347 domain-containing protein n=1 Tax=Okeania sp. SIO3I5 TaxID=2607805 RepID=UPI0013BDD9FB|nr:DUF4347 domain-containing protein [Okeania sp. SIO3I5]NEQ41257.1 DUF4347 domain-containing protein [Okeania sp. SIO3I5]
MLYPDRKIKPQSTSLVFIDAHLDNYQFLATGVVNDLEVIILDSTENGINKITETLQKKITTQNKIEAIHIFSHGSPGSLQLGNTFLNLDSLISAKEQIKQWKTALSKTANILLYGCNLAANIGGEFVQKLSQILGVNIAASVDLTGSKLLGGNWNLGFTTGKIVAENPLQPEVMASYNSVFATLTVTNNNDDGTGSLREAIATAQSGDTIEFSPSLANQTITLISGQLEIDKDLILDGGNAQDLTISGNNNSRVIDLQFTPDFQPTNLTVKNIIIADGRTTAVDREGAGAGIRTEQTSTLIVENSKFINNTAGGLGGGAIYSGFQSNATIINSQFENNDASQAIRNSSGQLSEHAGGAILIWSESNLTVRDSEFTNNKGVNGGAINNLLSNLTVENSQFINNDSTSAQNTDYGYGGAIYTDGASNNDGVSSGTIKISNSSFDGNKGAGQGGGLFLFAYPPDKIIIENSEIINNQIISNSVGDALGGGLRVGNAELTITNTTIANNLALSQGGGLWVGGNAPTEIINSTFSGNRAESEDGNSGLGGAILLANTSNSTNITNTTIANNYAGFQGGGFWGGNSNTTLTNTIVAYNVANNGGNNFNIFHNTGTEFSDGGGNIQSDELNPNDTKVTAGVTLTDPLLADLQRVDNIFIHPLLDNSPAIDAGVNGNAPDTDQIGQTRPVDGDNNGSSITDVGAFEFVVASSNPTPSNNQPTDISIDNNTVAENSENGTVVGSLTTTDSDADDTHTYTLLDDADGRFVVDGDRILVANGSILDFENNTTHTITVRTTDSGEPAESFDEQVTINVTDVDETPTPSNNPPTDISLDNNSITENSENGTVVGTLTTTDSDADDTHTYTLLNDADGRFAVDGNRILVANGSLFDFENNTTHTITVRTTDSGEPAESFDEQVTINVTDVDETPTSSNNQPTDISLDNNTVAENSENGTVVGTLTTTDSDADDTHTYTLLNDADGRFVLDGDRILVANGSILDFENNTTHTITVRTTDSGEPAESFDEQVTVNVTDVDETPANNNILGTPGSDRLTGTDNGDTFSGGEGNDTYIINNSADIIIEEGNAGIDTAESSITYRLPSNVENLVLTGENINGSGNSRNNYIAGSDGENKIVGGRGNDALLGASGADTIIGSIGNDILLGGAGNDILEGRSGRDRLNGGAGNDTLTGGASKDKFIFNTNQPFKAEDLGTDIITDFQENRDKILLDRDTFTAINSLPGEGFSIVEEFEVVSSDAQAETVAGVIIYNQTNGNLFYNQNGVANGFGEGGLFANVTNTPELESSDFQIR